MTETKTRSRQMYRCFECGLIIGARILDKDHYDGYCPKCGEFVDREFVPTPGQLRALGKKIASRVPATRAPARPASNDEADTVDELVREGKRTIRVGQQVVCQPKERKGTSRLPGEVIEIYADDTVLVDIGEGVSSRVHGDWVHVPNPPKVAS